MSSIGNRIRDDNQRSNEQQVSDHESPRETADDRVELTLVRVGIHGQVGRFASPNDSGFRRRSRVLCKTSRGLEVGQVLSSQVATPGQADGMILREMGPDDELLWGHLQALASEANQDCQEWLHNRGCDAVLLEVEPLMDGRTLYFHFLNDRLADEGLQQHVDHLAQVFEEKARNSEFAAQLEKGCGPGCGTEAAVNGCGSKGGCAVCKLASACKTH
ncbi:MAG: hypothetical protein AAGG44_07935 [Planctomycetota bacterium]